MYPQLEAEQQQRVVQKPRNLLLSALFSRDGLHPLSWLRDRPRICEVPRESHNFLITVLLLAQWARCSGR